MGKNVDAQAAGCPRNCDPDAAYIKCPPNPKKTEAGCTNCCVSTSRGCRLYYSNNTRLC
ncbi:hypothetical protein DM860_009474 [Cuscuta australis]|uniref:Uncharacterized protein n=1 Tax=Cuscuta australis TaxID=267555 RepID=A0A328DK31_9ASTE|nr:hypothetical protein DM860_009474 [Cuscuta australis]